ncbi:hypothetical protein QC823_13050 [Halomonas vilamensis]|uniref:Uncharacterized protein n=1 Tax=Vreelandella vilamensis TaxID=531309 RepID=A0ABU1H7S7_9GAMM|nr:hypothetical protein [Halomonas vilamensis]MDR5899916.1 hypothetical protein [Halomonas vilamensis]
MAAEHRQLRQTLIFLRTSFEAVQHSIAGRLDDPLPCWLDASLLAMLSRELKRCYQEAALVTPSVAKQVLMASQNSDLLLKQCPGVLSSAVCHRQLDAVLLPLEAAISLLTYPEKRRWPWQRH